MQLDNIKRRLAIACGAALASLSAFAVPPLPGFVSIPQPDGSVIEAKIVGDNEFHYYVTRDGSYMVADRTDGFLKPASHDRIRELIDADLLRRSDANVVPQSRIAPGAIRKDFPTTGVVKGLIVLAEFQDVKFQEASTPEYFRTKLNKEGYTGEETAGSALDYFMEQSKGQFTPQFDVVGPITLPQKRADYGLNENLVGLFSDAAKLADTECNVDFSEYDIDKDHYVDFFFVIFAGHGEAQGGPVECVWPAMKDVSYDISERFDNKYLGVAACSCELKGGEGSDLDGVGTVCHEFSHIIGLPDTYDPQGTGCYGMGHFDMMCYGPYNGDMRVPSGYTAMDKYTLGWIEPRVLEAPEKDVTLKPLSTDNECIFIVNPDNKDEYYTLENRQLKGFDSALPGHGLVISYVNYNRSIWKKNSPNTLISGYEHVSIVAADNSKTLNTKNSLNYEEGDPFPGKNGVTAFTDNTKPAAIWLASGTEKPAGISITNIRENEDGTITFDYNADAAVGAVEVESGDVEYFNLQGMKVNPATAGAGIYIVRDGQGNCKKVVK